MNLFKEASIFSIDAGRAYLQHAAVCAYYTNKIVQHQPEIIAGATLHT